MLEPVSNRMCMSDPSTMPQMYAVKEPLLQVTLYATSELLCSVFSPPLEGTVGLGERDRFCNLPSGAIWRQADGCPTASAICSFPADRHPDSHMCCGVADRHPGDLRKRHAWALDSDYCVWCHQLVCHTEVLAWVWVICITIRWEPGVVVVVSGSSDLYMRLLEHHLAKISRDFNSLLFI